MGLKEKGGYMGYIKNLLKEKSYVILTILGKSMLPLIEDKDKILVLKVNPEEISYGDIILCQIKDRLLAHRIVYLKREKEIVIRAKGDANIELDDIFPCKNILGKIVAIQKGRRWMFIDNKIWDIINKMIAFYSLRGFKNTRLFCESLKVLTRLSLFFVNIKEFWIKLYGGFISFENEKKTFVLTPQGEIYSLNPMAKRIWGMILDNKSIEEIIVKIEEEFGLKKEVVKNDIANFLYKIKEQGLVMAKKDNDLR